MKGEIKQLLFLSSVANITSSFHVLKSCNDCLIFSINSTARNPEKLLALMKLNSNITEETVRAFYLFCKKEQEQERKYSVWIWNVGSSFGLFVFQPESRLWRTQTWNIPSSRRAASASPENQASTTIPTKVIHLETSWDLRYQTELMYLSVFLYPQSSALKVRASGYSHEVKKTETETEEVKKKWLQTCGLCFFSVQDFCI